MINKICRKQSKACQQSIEHCEGGSHHMFGSTGSAVFESAVYPSRRGPRQRRLAACQEHYSSSLLVMNFPAGKAI